ncbi:MobF family relaxase [Phycicoccus flavus]|uniref:Relaxase domain-containing protein n=1 Tax=Phycicoccus flavus TaxID=2502783 RepID=A0A8T6R995_9MICO|nr:MobF family relaxase [Phycicoccus flavus]NHA69970.1 relaxase domain-containing protein [Phycicoccus flavus]
MSIHKLTAGSGYDYLTRQVAAQDVTERGHSGLASYYSAQGEAPGTWLGSGLDGLAGLNAGDVVTAEQMRNLFGAGRHPLAEQLREQAAEAGLDLRAQDHASSLGKPFNVYAGDVSEFRRRVAQRVAEANTAAGLPADAPGSLEDRARIRTEVAAELFRDEYGRDPADAREVAATIAKHSRPRTNAVAGYDLTFSPVKSVSTLWAVAPQPVAAAIERAHQQAVRDALTYLERHALFTREGAQGARQVETRGLVAAAFTHRDSRAGDPDLHTHVAVANKVQARASGAWLAIDGRLLFKATVAASETYNTRLEHHLRHALGVRFAARPGPDPRKRPVREIVGVEPALNELWSSRRASIEARREDLAKTFQATHGRPPTPIESIQLAQRATLETRAAKHEPRSLDQQRTTWAREATDALGSARALQRMVAAALSPQARTAPRVDSAWVRDTAARIHDTLASRRSHWQRWHAEAEALRKVRGLELDTTDIDRVVALLVDQVLTEQSVPLTRPGDDLEVPQALQRSDGSSVYTVAGADLFTSPALLHAEARIVAAAGRTGGMRVPPAAVEMAMLASAANGLPLNAGQATLVREMATSGARLQLAVAPAGAGKTTAMRALAHAWTEVGGDVVGLAPSAAAASVLGENLEATTDTMAKLTWHLDHPDREPLPAWAQRIGPGTLVVVDEAGMADTLTLDAVVRFATDRGASLRLIGDDQQLAAVGAGGVLRDIQATHGSLHLSELMRFADPAEGAASLALREGLPEALGFYLDNGRLHVGDLATMTDDVFTAWAGDHAEGHDAVMLAPTRALVAHLNDRARTHRLATHPDAPTASVPLADGARASVGDTVITRTNDRTLRMTATDWVKNGDRWHVTALEPGGAVTVQHVRNGHHVRLPQAYVAASVDLGYAATIHTAQGVTADASHTLLTGEESRQLAYTAATRGRVANHLYLEVVGDGDEHDIVKPESTHPLTATELLQRVLARDDSSRSASTMRREADDPATQLTQAVARYTDSLHVAAEARLGPLMLARLDNRADHVVPDITRAPAWPTLRAHLVLRSAHGLDPLQDLHQVAAAREVDSAADVASVLDWRLDDSGLRSAGTGPLPWLPGIPEDLADDPQWGPYLAARAARVRDLQEQVGAAAATAPALPTWARQGQGRPSPDLLADVAVWRAATGVDPADRRPTGAAHPTKAGYRHQENLQDRLLAGRTPAMAEWAPTLETLLVHPREDPFTPLLAERLAALTRARIDAPALLHRALADGPLPDDHNAAALWWRLARHLSPAVAAQAGTEHHLDTPWADRLTHTVGEDRASQLRVSPWWPTLVAVVDHAAARGANPEDLLAPVTDLGADLDPCQALIWQISVQNDPPPPVDHAPDPAGTDDPVDEPNPFWDDDADHPGHLPTDDEWQQLVPAVQDEPHRNDADDDLGHEPHVDDLTVASTLHLAAQVRRNAGVLDPTGRELDALLARAYDDDTAPVSRERIIELNQAALEYYTARYPGSWAQHYLSDRARTDLTGDPHLQPGYAPAGWTSLVTHLRRQGVTDLELTESGLATHTRSGRIIDRFRDRLVLPITAPTAGWTTQVLGFVGRRRDDTEGPKYLNTPDTPAFHKGAQLYTSRPDLLDAGATPVLVEGPLDALAINLAGNGNYVGVAPLGTALTQEQARQLAQAAHQHRQQPIVATDPDLAGQTAAHRAYWLLAQHNLDPTTVALRPGTDPAALLHLHGASEVRSALTAVTPLADALLQERLTHLDGMLGARQALTVLAASHPSRWEAGIDSIAETSGVPHIVLRRHLADAVARWEHEPHDLANHQLDDTSSARARLSRQTDPAPDRIPTSPPGSLTSPSQTRPTVSR